MSAEVMAASLTREQLLRAYRQMKLIRVFEERLHAEVATGGVPGFTHLYAGQEAVAVGVCEHLTNADHIASTHRGHGHCLAKGSSPERMMSEIFGRRTGLCAGKGGSMHVADIERGFLGANGIVGAGFPIATGAALAHKLRKSGRVAVAFGGDGSSNQGAVFEAINLAVVLKLPIVFVFENNGFSQFTAAEFAIGSGDLLARAKAFGLPGVRVDGTDFFAVHAAAGGAIGRARDGGGPTVIEAKLARFFGHFEGDPQQYRTRADIAASRADLDCLVAFRRQVCEDGSIAPAVLNAIDSTVMQVIDDAVASAKRSPSPATVGELLEHVYASPRETV
ncbi:MAG TPA: thiamine pyrophosphate-dependent dehydrogenase E1 component subunit alpha [Steroidobacteraceae bacterium]|nr:thiamine pyrophosphate-dependent dehydrogenase E1 component subunit alpha [Steroidobacteraceae bacterium]